MKTRLIFVRHGESEANVQHRFAGDFDAPLTALGRMQAERAAQALKDMKIDCAYASNLSRAWETGRILIAPHEGLELMEETGFREIRGGEWEGKTFRELSCEYPEEWGRWMGDMINCRCPGGESMRELALRALEVSRRTAEREQGKTVLIATHSTLIKTLQPLWAGLPAEAVGEVPWVENASISIVDYEDGVWTPVVIGENKHLTGLSG
ncbi:MAG: histidine phosphatase family protein [Clostridia bacterium]|nr:histidine phosphatase family protein [Clostridia bacterium]